MYKRIPPTVVPAKAGIHKKRRPILIPEIRFIYVLILVPDTSRTQNIFMLSSAQLLNYLCEDPSVEG